MCADTEQPRAAYMFNNISEKRTRNKFFFSVKAFIKGNFARLSDMRYKPFDRPKKFLPQAKAAASQYVLFGMKLFRGAAL